MQRMREVANRSGGRGNARRLVLAWVAAVGALVIAAPSAFANTDSVRFDFGQNGRWTVPDGVTSIEVEVAGAGGGGGSRNANLGGGDGALVTATIAVDSGVTLDVGVGGGGEANSAFGTSSSSGGGGASIVTSSSTDLTDLLIIAGGGGGATGWSNSSGGDAGNKGSPASSGGEPGANGKGGVLSGATSGSDYNSAQRVGGNGGQTGRAAVVGGAGGEARHGSLGGGGGAGYGGGSSGKEAIPNLRGGGGGGGSTAQGAAIDTGSIVISTAGGAGGSTDFGQGGDGWVIIRWLVPPPLPDPDVPSGAASVQREPVVLTLTMPAGLACSAPTSDASGTWIQLPAANECNDDASNTGRSGEADELLGWATTPDFPTDIAQRQVDNGWGAYELFDESGALSAVFIPAGGWTQASSDTSLFPIWS